MPSTSPRSSKKRLPVPTFVLLFALLLAALPAHRGRAQQSANERSEDEYYRLESLPLPQDIILEVGGMTFTPGGKLAVATRHGDVWFVENPQMRGGVRPTYHLFARGLHEPLGLAYTDGAFYAAQRGELTRLKDTNGDDRADLYDTVVSWPLSGNYHEYSYGPEVRPNGNMVLTLNVGWQGEGVSLVPWRGWVMEVTPEGEMRPFAAGLRSPAGFGFTPEGDLLYAENQGDWVGSGRISHVEKGDFLGHAASLRWTDQPGVPESLQGLTPDDVPSTGKPMHEVAKSIPSLKTPAVWFPHTVMGISTSDILVDSTGGAFGPFAGQYFVGDQGHSRVMRMDLEKVKGAYQGAAFPFREDFASGVVRLIWGPDGGLYAGMTSRGWNARGERRFGLQRLAWTGRTPFEMKTVHARPDGFEITFTRPVDRAVARDSATYEVSSFTYKYHHQYGSDVIRLKKHPVRSVEVSEDGRSVRLAVEGMRKGFIHEVALSDRLRAEDRTPLLHNTAYYTLKNIPEGERMLARRGSASTGGGASAEDASATTQAGGASSAAQASAVPSDSSSSVASPTSGGRLKEHQTELPASWTDGPDESVSIAAAPGLQYDKATFDVGAGSRVKLVLANPTDLQHNLVGVAPGTWSDVAQQAIDLGLQGAEMDYVPKTDQVLFHTKLLKPGSSETIYFRAPEEPGEYTYVCTFPGHAQSMRGTMTVTTPQ